MTQAEPEAKQDGTPNLVRGLGLTDATMIVMGSMIGSGIFITSAESSKLVGSPGWLLVAWGLAGLMTLTGALCCAELAAMATEASPTSTTPTRCVMAMAVSAQRVAAASQIFCKRESVEGKKRGKGSSEFFRQTPRFLQI